MIDLSNIDNDNANSQLFEVVETKQQQCAIEEQRTNRHLVNWKLENVNVCVCVFL